MSYLASIPVGIWVKMIKPIMIGIGDRITAPEAKQTYIKIPQMASLQSQLIIKRIFTMVQELCHLIWRLVFLSGSLIDCWAAIILSTISGLMRPLSLIFSSLPLSIDSLSCCSCSSVSFNSPSTSREDNNANRACLFAARAAASRLRRPPSSTVIITAVFILVPLYQERRK